MHPEESDPGTSAFRICFVCTGNICRSVMAEVVLRDLVAQAGLAGTIVSTSAGTGGWHVGEPADTRTVDALRQRGYDGAGHRARQFDPDWFEAFDLVVALDHGQDRILKSWARTETDLSKVHLLLSFDADQAEIGDVPDPYYSDSAMFDAVLGMIERSLRALFRQLEPAIRQGATR